MAIQITEPGARKVRKLDHKSMNHKEHKEHEEDKRGIGVLESALFSL
jgi:hypothetical protein